jgi:hypothetical protein
MEQINGLIRRRIIPVLSFLALLASQPVLAQDKNADARSRCNAACMKDTAISVAAQLIAYPKKLGVNVVEQLKPGSFNSDHAMILEHSRLSGPSTWDMQKIAFHDNTTLASQLKNIEDLTLLTFWENRSAKLYIGISRDGVAGINIRQKRPHKVASSGKSRSSKLDAKPIIHDPYALIAGF